ncbi:hemerythrin domain-containing protein [Candidatus Dactylopiibacterium carminicum]|nr:hemerythrin domain-containing protein [Candidatus Dactylopiibacterium carminicum]
MRKPNLRLKHLAQEHQAVMHFTSVMRAVRPENDEDLPEVVRRMLQVFSSDLEPHFQEEEAHVLPLLRQHGHTALADEVQTQHDRMRAINRTLESAPSAALVVEFVHLLEQHVEFEEGEVWEVLETLLEPEEARAQH